MPFLPLNQQRQSTEGRSPRAIRNRTFMWALKLPVTQSTSVHWTGKHSRTTSTILRPLHKSPCVSRRHAPPAMNCRCKVLQKVPVASTRVEGWGDEPCEPTVRLPDWSELVASYSRMKTAWGWANGGQPILVCYIRKYVIILGDIPADVPPTKISGGCVPGIPGRGWHQCRMALLTATSAFGLGRRRWSSPQQCYLHCLRCQFVFTSTKQKENEEKVAKILKTKTNTETVKTATKWKTASPCIATCQYTSASKLCIYEQYNDVWLSSAVNK